MALVNDEMDIDMEDEGQTPAESSALVGVNNFMFIPPPKDTKYGEPHLDRLPPIILERILSHLGTRAIAALRRVCTLISHVCQKRVEINRYQTCKALNNAISDTPEIWAGLVRRFRRATSNVLLMGSHPVLMPRVDHANGYQEDLLRCAYILRRKWSSPVFQARQLAGTNIIRHGAFGFIDQAGLACPWTGGSNGEYRSILSQTRWAGTFLPSPVLPLSYGHWNQIASHGVVGKSSRARRTPHSLSAI